MDAPAPTGHFTTFQVRDGAVRGLDLHLARLGDSTRLMFDHGLDLAGLRTRIRDAIARAGGHACTVRVVVTGRPRTHDGGHPVEAPLARIDVEAPREPGRLALRLQSRRVARLDPQIKHLAIAPQLDARRRAQAAGFDDALLVNDDGLVAEGSFWNIGLGGRAGITWPLAPALRGVTERLLQARLADAGVAQQAVPVHLDALAAHGFAFAANSRGLQAIASIDGYPFRGDERLAATLHAAYEAIAWQAV